MSVIKRVNPVSLAKVNGIIGVIIGLIAGILLAVFGGLIGSFAPQAGGIGAPSIGAGLGIASIIILPIMYGIGGFIGGLIGGWAYNLVAKWVGGIEIDLENK